MVDYAFSGMTSPFWDGGKSYFSGKTAPQAEPAPAGDDAGFVKPSHTVRDKLPWETYRSVSDQMTTFKGALRDAANLTTVGIQTLSGVSPKSCALEDLAPMIASLPSPDEQARGVEELLREGNKLYPDQHAHIIARTIKGLITPGEIALLDRSYGRVGHHLLQAGLKVAPELISDNLVSDSSASDILKHFIKQMAEHPEFEFSTGVNAILESAGLMEPLSEDKFRNNWDDSPECMANWLRGEIAALVEQQIMPAHLTELLNHLVTLPDDLRGRILATVVNTFWNVTRNPENNEMVSEIGFLIEELPYRIRLTPLEAYHNQLNHVPHEMAVPFAPILHRLVGKIPDVQDFRFNRSKRDLLTSLEQQMMVLSKADFRPGESMLDLNERLTRARIN